METLNSQIESQLIEAGASLVGFADVSGLPAAARGEMKSAISIAVALDVSIINEISEGPTQRYFHEYTRVNEFLARLCASTVDDLQKRGHDASAIEPTIRIKDSAMKFLTTPLPHKTVATRAGMGWIGKSALLITRRYGPAVRLATVLTDAPLDAGNPVDDSQCGDCTKCVDRCPANAIAGENWAKGMERESIYDAQACRAEAKSASGSIGVPVTICGICINACPWTQKYVSRDDRTSR
jgi:epoxyqueuosine reductase QueG